MTFRVLVLQFLHNERRLREWLRAILWHCMLF